MRRPLTSALLVGGVFAFIAIAAAQPFATPSWSDRDSKLERIVGSGSIDNVGVGAGDSVTIACWRWTVPGIDLQGQPTTQPQVKGWMCVWRNPDNTAHSFVFVSP